MKFLLLFTLLRNMYSSASLREEPRFRDCDAVFPRAGAVCGGAASVEGAAADDGGRGVEEENDPDSEDVMASGNWKEIWNR